MQIDKVIGQRICAFRKDKNMTQAELANALDISIDQIRAYETGERRVLPSHLWKIADHLGISVVRLFQDSQCTQQEAKEVQDMLDQLDTLPSPQKNRIVLQMRALSCPEMKPFPPPNKRPQ